MSTVLSYQQVLHAFTAAICVNIQTVQLPPGLRSHKELEVFGWSRIPNNTGSRSRIFCQSLTLEVQLDHFLHHTPNCEFLLKWFNFF